MKKIEVTTVQELQGILADFDDRYLFRGQSRNYPDEASNPSLLPSFFVNGGMGGCIPNLRQRWSTYASFIIYTILGHNRFNSWMSEAILQHYGWKSFFLDVSLSPYVASWFASNVYKQETRIHMSEDCWEIPVFLRNLEASYIPSENSGHLYIISKEALEKKGLTLLDLSILKTEKGNSRPERQQALLAGPFDGQSLPIECIVYHISGPSSVFRSFADIGNFHDLESVFPPATEDPIYNNLLSAPWHKIVIPNEATLEEGEIDFYERFLEIPDYHPVFRKHLSPDVALYKSFKLHDIYLEKKEPFNNPVFIEIDDIIYFSPVAPERIDFKKLIILLNNWDTIFFELDLIVPRPDMEVSEAYTKGLVLEKKGNNIFCLFELIVTYNGTERGNIGGESGWHYKYNTSGKIERFLSDEDCPCGNNKRHEFHMDVLKRIECRLQEGSEQLSERIIQLS